MPDRRAKVELSDGMADGHVWRRLWKEMGVFGGGENLFLKEPFVVNWW
jgi:hypothetical protein